MNRLRAYRSIEGINQEELAGKFGVSAQMVGAMESGRRRVSVDLNKLGYAPERLHLPDMSEPLHRHRASTKAAAKKRAHELLRLAGELFGELRQTTQRTPPLSLERLNPPETMDDIEELAIDVRCMIQHEELGPIQNLTAAVERAGVCIVPIVGLDGIDGLSAWVEDTPVIGVSPTVPGDRFRFTLAHELGHLLFHRRKTDTVEHEANRFAGALLFPRDEFDAAIGDTRPNLRDFVALKAQWGLAVAALVYRSHELDHIGDDRYRALQIQMSKWRRNEPGRFEPVHGQLLAKMIEVNGGASVVAKQTGLSPRHISELTNWSHLRLAAT